MESIFIISWPGVYAIDRKVTTSGVSGNTDYLVVGKDPDSKLDEARERNVKTLEFITTDPTRIIQAIIMGVSFIGAGMVLQIEKEKEVKYLTSAATILFSSGIGIAVALKQYILSAGITLFILFINYSLGHYKKIKKKTRSD